MRCVNCSEGKCVEQSNRSVSCVLRATVVAVAAFLDAFQKVADLATGSRGNNPRTHAHTLTHGHFDMNTCYPAPFPLLSCRTWTLRPPLHQADELRHVRSVKRKPQALCPEQTFFFFLPTIHLFDSFTFYVTFFLIFYLIDLFSCNSPPPPIY